MRPIHDYLIRADKDKKRNRKIAGVDFYVPTDYDPYREDNATQDGIIAYVSARNPLGLKEGDRVYCHHFLTDISNHFYVGDELMFKLEPGLIYAKVENDKLIALGEWCIMDIIYEDEADYKTESGIFIKANAGKKQRLGKIVAPSQEAVELGLQEGDEVFFGERKYKVDYQMYVEGVLRYRIPTKYILGKKITYV